MVGGIIKVSGVATVHENIVFDAETGRGTGTGTGTGTGPGKERQKEGDRRAGRG